MSWKIRLANGQTQNPNDIILFIRGPGELEMDIPEAQVLRRVIKAEWVTVIMRDDNDIDPGDRITIMPEAVGEQGSLTIGLARWLLSPEDTAVVEAALKRECFWCGRVETAVGQCYHCKQIGCAEDVVSVDGVPTCPECAGSNDLQC